MIRNPHHHPLTHFSLSFPSCLSLYLTLSNSVIYSCTLMAFLPFAAFFLSTRCDSEPCRVFRRVFETGSVKRLHWLVTTNPLPKGCSRKLQETQEMSASEEETHLFDKHIEESGALCVPHVL